MTGQEIRMKIAANDKKLEELLVKHQFVLNKQISQLLKENADLVRQCPHVFEQGQCIFCRTNNKS